MLKGHCMGLNLPPVTQNLAEEAAPSVPKNNLSTKLRQLIRQACRMITVVVIFNSWLLKVILGSAVVETSVIDWKREACVRVLFKRQQDIFRY